MVHPDCSGDIVLAGLVVGGVTGEDDDSTAILVDRLPGSFNAAGVAMSIDAVGLDRSSTVGAVIVAAVGKVVRLGLPGLDLLLGFDRSFGLLSGFNLLLHTVFAFTATLKGLDVSLCRSLTAGALADAVSRARAWLGWMRDELERLCLRCPLPGLRRKVHALVRLVRHGVASDFLFTVLVRVSNQNVIVKVRSTSFGDSQSSVLLEAAIVHGADMGSFSLSALDVVVEGVEQLACGKGAADASGQKESGDFQHGW